MVSGFREGGWGRLGGIEVLPPTVAGGYFLDRDVELFESFLTFHDEYVVCTNQCRSLFGMQSECLFSLGSGYSPCPVGTFAKSLIPARLCVDAPEHFSLGHFSAPISLARVPGHLEMPPGREGGRLLHGNRQLLEGAGWLGAFCLSGFTWTLRHRSRRADFTAAHRV